MKKRIFSLLFTLVTLAATYAQEKPVQFTVEVSTDSILMSNYFEVKFILENANGQNFEAPDFSQHFHVVSGPNFSSSFSMVNGDMTQSMTITYYLEPRDIGAYYILPASVEANGKVLETTPKEVLVVPNPEGIRQTPPRQQHMQLFDWGSPFDGSFDFSLPQPKQLQPPPPPPGDKPQKKKKRKTTRI
jgi:hypothetical protein